ncbi:PPOX class F420-dependent oxidoreductase [Dactylosporangium fulvum]|uniref:PPOX class F420-dependent oxidoreductase n=1 Tax=Dactylosporangium fulvum TaxID=53359 RepID=A0ABY5W5J9_9ACTN|nr:PPOX class F420-dependent oxidoreductase [Dactylosporangium fulvum]UWP84376.1 PPOX class F420-dependent oxidoreductase [Dactylosporangium fulvum]
MATFSTAELEYLATQRLGRLATLPGDGYPQNNAVGFWYNTELGTIDIGGWQLGASRKFANVLAYPKATLVVDDIASVRPWRVRGVEIRADAEALTDVEPSRPGLSRELIRLHPRRIVSWGLETPVP